MAHDPLSAPGLAGLRRLRAELAALPPDAPAPARAALAESIAAALLATQPAPQPVLPWRWRLGLVGAVLSVGLLGYAWKGSMAGWHPAPPPNPAEAMVQRLADRIAAAPDSAQPAEWAMLGRSLTVLGRQAEAIAAYRQALARLGKAAAPEAAGWRVDLADLLGSAKSGSLAGEPAELVAQALAQDDRHPKALALAGAAAWQAGEHEQARRYWRRLLEVTPADEPLRRIAEQGLAQP